MSTTLTTIVSNAPSVAFTPVSGAIGALYDVGGTGVVKLGLTFSSTGRAPAITELYARGGHDGPDTFETGDPDLKIARPRQIFVGERERKFVPLEQR